jgi:hypothetical protein
MGVSFTSFLICPTYHDWGPFSIARIFSINWPYQLQKGPSYRKACTISSSSRSMITRWSPNVYKIMLRAFQSVTASVTVRLVIKGTVVHIDAITNPSASLAITPIPIFLSSLSRAASQFII